MIPEFFRTPGGGQPAPLSGPVPRFRRRLRRACGRVLSRASAALLPTRLGRALHARLIGGIDVVRMPVELPHARARIEWPRIAFLSDLHAGHFLAAADLERLGERLMALAPDLVCLGGDLIDHFHEELPLLDPLLARLRAAPLGVHAVPGNHDYVELGCIDRWTRHLERNGVRVLRNRGTRLERGGGALWLCGVDDLTEGEPRLDDALAGRRAGEPALLLSHHPDLFRDACQRDVDLQLSGHTHGGQWRFFGATPVHHSRFGWFEGIHARGDARLFVGRGAGVTAVPLRIATRGEVTLLEPRGAR